MADPYETQAGLPWPPWPHVRSALFSLHYAYPAIIFSYYIATSAVAFCTLQTKSAASKHAHIRLILILLFFAVLTYFIQLASLLIQSLALRAILFSQDTIIGLLSCILVFGVEFAGLSESEKPVWYPYIGSLCIAIVLEPVIEALAMLSRTPGSFTYVQFLDIFTVAVRYLSFIAILVIYYGTPCRQRQGPGIEAERQSLIPKEDTAERDPAADADGREANDYGAVSDTSSSTSSDHSQAGDGPESSWERRDREAREHMEKRLAEKGNWLTYAKSFLVFLPYIWPVNNRSLQLRAVLVGLCLLAMNFVNLLMPRQLGVLLDCLDGKNDKNPWVQVIIFAVLKLIASESGLIMIRRRLWIPVELYSFDAISTAAYSHVLNLSSDFHDTKSSSDIMMAIQSGQSVSNMLESVCFQAIPMFIDMTVASIYLSITFGPYEGFITIATATLFLYVATRMMAALKSARRSEVSAWFEEHYIRQAGIQGWSTVACFNQISYEEGRYSAAVRNRVVLSQRVSLGYITAYAFQYLTLLCGLLAGLFLAVYQVSNGQATAGQFIMLLTYWAQLVAPLSFFASLGKSISKDFINAERLLEIMQTQPTVVNKEGALPLAFRGGHVSFDHVGFSYDNKKGILDDINLSVLPGTTVAFVGPTGAGKSTILKLIDRFYDATEGSVKIDGQDIRDVELSSLRAQIGVVPQSPILFDDTVMNNVRYAKLTATDEEVFDACKAACIHDQIVGFTEGYNTRVGERGIKLSGGELQRVAIARAILKRPAIVLLDEATSAVDTETEQKIQEAFRTLCKGRTTFIVAHRLSTIINADRIVVVNNGRIIEQGSHEELIRAKGKYADLWSKQVFVKPKAIDKTKDQAADKGPNIVNDLAIEVSQSELAKIQEHPSTPTQSKDSSR